MEFVLAAILAAVLLVSAVFFYRRGLPIWALVIGVSAIAVLLYGYWSDIEVEDDDTSVTDVPTGAPTAPPSMSTPGQ